MVELSIERLAAGGEGVGRLDDGRIVFVAGTTRGDRVRARLVENRKRWARGEVVELLEASPARVDPVCEDFGRCGGCTWQHVPYRAQIEARREILRDALRRIGRFDTLPEIQMEDLSEPGAGVRAQAIDRKGNLLQDFAISETENAIHVLGAPSPGATSSLTISRYIVDKAEKSFELVA